MRINVHANEARITHVTDTALWVAAVRANESTRRAALFRDPLAGTLGGIRGAAIARSMPDAAGTHWGVVIRTSAIDRLLLEAIRQGTECVVNLGAGMDTRPYRLDLPTNLRWIELDFPALIKLKQRALEGCAPVCRLERVGLNLLDEAARRELLARYGSSSTLVVAEGLVPYLANDDVAKLAEDLRPNCRHWILDFDDAGDRKIPDNWGNRLQAAPFLFRPVDWFGFFEACGWQATRVITSAEESALVNRPYPYSFPRGLIMRGLPRSLRLRILSASGAALLSPASAA